jgi:hypothetical protein
MDTPEISEGDTCTIRLNTEGRLADFERARVRRYNGEDQALVDVTDRGLDYVPQMVEKQLNWGSA